MTRWRALGLIAAAWGVLAVGMLLGIRVPGLLALSLAALPAAVLSGAIAVREPGSPVAPALAWSSASILLVEISGALAESSDTASPLPGAGYAVHWRVGVWPVNLAGLLALLLTFPGGAPERPRGWSSVARLLPWGYAVGTVLVIAALWDVQQVEGRVQQDDTQSLSPMVLLGIALVAGCLVLAVADLATRYRHGAARARRQIRWLLLAAVIVLVLLVAGWAGQLAELPLLVSFGPFLGAILLLVPVAVTIAILRDELVDVDWLLSGALAWVVALLLSSALFAVLMFGIALALPGGGAAGVAVASFLAALVLLPLHRVVSKGVGRVVDRDRVRAVALAERFTAEVRAGTRDPEEVEAVLRLAQGDPALRLLIREPAADRWIQVDGGPATPNGAAVDLVLRTGTEVAARIELGRESDRARRQAGVLAGILALPIEVCRLRVSLHRALEEARASRARLARATALERRRLERDLHDGAQQRVIGIGLRLRALQLRLGTEYAAEIDRAVAELQETAEELRRLAHGIRPSRLDDGLAAALAALQATTPIPVTLRIGELPELDETRTTTAYYLTAEAVTNSLKHARPSYVSVWVRGENGQLLVIVEDDGIGLPGPEAPPALADRAASVGGTLCVDSIPSGGTKITAVIPCES